MFKPIHQHLLIKAFVNSVIVDPRDGNQMLEDLVRIVGMKAVTEPKSTYVSEPGNLGLTGSINLATSHIAYHIWDENKLLMLDVYSCKPFKESDIVLVLEEVFEGFTSYHSVTIDRNNI